VGAHEPPARSTSRQVKESPNAVYDRENQPRQAFEQQLKHNLSDDGQHSIGIGRPAPTPEPRLLTESCSDTGTTFRLDATPSTRSPPSAR
jgi:hypothetical protein